MSSNSLRAELKNFLDLLVKAEIALIANPVIQKKEPGGMMRVTWASPSNSSGNDSGELFRGTFATVDDYRSWLEAQEYSAVLYDGALLQLSYDTLGDQIIGHRLAYYPCPFDVDEQLLRSEPLLDVIDVYRDQGTASIRLRSPLRFDYDPANSKKGHPATHLTLLWHHCRWAIVAPLSLGHFVRFVFQHFYPTLWNAHEFLRLWSQDFVGTRSITPEEERSLHIACMR